METDAYTHTVMKHDIPDTLWPFQLFYSPSAFMELPVGGGGRRAVDKQSRLFSPGYRFFQAAARPPF